MAVVVDDVDRAGVYARSSQGRRVQPAATNRHSHISTRRWCVGGLAVKQDAHDRSRVFSRAIVSMYAAFPFPSRRYAVVHSASRSSILDADAAVPSAGLRHPNQWSSAHGAVLEWRSREDGSVRSLPMEDSPCEGRSESREDR